MPRLEGVATWFLRDLREIDGLLRRHGARLVPTGMHPTMDPTRETRLWPHDYADVYAMFHRLFDCHRHGWANLQSCHLNLPFQGDEEFAALHAANPGFWRSPAPLLGLIIAGLYLGTAYLATGRLYLPVALHTAWNLFEGPVFGFRVSGIQTPSLLAVRETGPALWTGGAFGPEAGLLVPLALLLHFPLLLVVARRLPGPGPARPSPVDQA